MGHKWVVAIELVEVVSATQKRVKLANGRYASKDSSEYCYRKTWGECQEWLVAQWEWDVNQARLRLNNVSGKLGNAKGLIEPESK